MPAKSLRSALAVMAVVSLGWSANNAVDASDAAGSTRRDQVSNDTTFRNPAGRAGTFSTQGSIDLTSEFFRAQGANGRSCASCHIPAEAWSINPGTLQQLFDETDGTHPVFNTLDANNPAMNVDTVEQRLAAYSMLLRRGVFRRGGAPRADAEWELTAAEDPHGFANLTRLVHWRRVMPTINFVVGSAAVNWDGGNSVGADQRAGLVLQATRNITGAQQGPPPASTVVDNIVDFQLSLSSAQVLVHGVGRLDAGDARGGPRELSRMPKVEGRFDLFDAWIDHGNRRRAQVARGQELFNTQNAGGGRCGTCHNAANNGTSMRDLFFDVGAASADARTSDLPLYTFRNRSTGEVRQLSDAGRGNVTGLWRDLGRFKTPTLRALSARAPYFHNGIAETLEEVVRHYETHLGFIFTHRERDDLVAFLKAL
jgi:cytochrome c peroxidase